MVSQILLNFEALFNDLQESIIAVNGSGIILNLNNSALDVLSYDRSEILNKQISHICCDKTLENVIKTNPIEFSTSLCTKYKQLIPIRGKLEIIEDYEDAIIVFKLFKIEEVFNNVNTYSIKNSSSYTNFIKDTNGRYLFINDVFEKYFKKDKNDVLQKFDRDLWDKDLSYKIRREDLYVISTKNSYVSFNSQVIDDEVIYYETSKSPMFDENNKVVAVLGMTRDITESVKLRNELVVQNEQLSIMYKILNNSYSNLNLQSLFSCLHKDFKTLLNVDCICLHLYNFKTNELEYCTSYGISQNFMDSYINTEVCKSFMNDVFTSKIPVPMTCIRDFNSEIKTKYTEAEGIYYCACYPLVYNGVSFGVVNFGCKSEEYSYSWDNRFMEAICKNISILLQNAILYNQLEENLKYEKEVNEQINLFFDTTLDFFCIIDKNNMIKKVGKQMLEALGYEAEEMLSKHIGIFVHPDDKAEARIRVHSHKEAETIEIIARIRCKNGEYRNIDWNTKYLHDRGVFVCSGRDLTYKLDLEQKRKKFEDSLQLEKLKSEFLSSISHELRTPIAIIYGAIHIIESNLNEFCTDNPKRLNEYVNSIKKNTFRLLRLFNNILEITNVDAGFINLELETHNIVKVVEDISLSVAEHLTDKGVKLIFDTAVEEIYVNVDVKKMERVMLNLISNSVKYSKKDENSEIFVSIYEENHKIFISVKDNGIGMSEQHLASIFDRFNQSKGSMTRNTEGSGIGLYLVKTLLQMQGADISAKSVLGKGSEFVIEFPINENVKLLRPDYDIEEDFSVKIENFDMEFSDIISLNQ